MKKFATMNTLYIVAAIIAISAFLLPGAIDAINLQVNGISHIDEQGDDYYKISEPVDGNHSVTLDLNDLAANRGRILFDDGDSQIAILEVAPREEGGYEVTFRSHGKELQTGAVLVSGIDHARADNGLSQSFSAEAVADVEGEAVELTPSFGSGLVYHDGDRFGFYLDVPEGSADEVEVTVTNLQLNLWMEKAIFE